MDDPFDDNGKDPKGFFDDTGAAVPPPKGVAALEDYVVEAPRSRRGRHRSSRASPSQAEGDEREEPDVTSTDAFPPLPVTIAPRPQQSTARIPAELTRALESTHISNTSGSQQPTTPQRAGVVHNSYDGLYTFDNESRGAFPHDNAGGNFHLCARSNKDVLVYQYKCQGSARSWTAISVVLERDIPRFKQELDALAGIKRGRTEGDYSDRAADSQLLSLVNIIGQQPSLFQPDVPAGGSSQSPAIIISPRRSSNERTDTSALNQPEHDSTQRSVLVEQGRQANVSVDWMDENPLKGSQSYHHYLDQFKSSPQKSQGPYAGGTHNRRVSNLDRIDETTEATPPSVFGRHMSNRQDGPKSSFGSSGSAPAGRVHTLATGPFTGQQPVIFPRPAGQPMNTGIPVRQVQSQPVVTTPTRNPAPHTGTGSGFVQQSAPARSHFELPPTAFPQALPSPGIIGGHRSRELTRGWYPTQRQTKEQYETELNDFWNSGKKRFDELQGRVTDSLASSDAPISREKEASLRLMTSLHSTLQSYAYPEYKKDEEGNPVPIINSISRGSPFTPLPPGPGSPAATTQIQRNTALPQQQSQQGQSVSLTPRAPPRRSVIPLSTAPLRSPQQGEASDLPGLAPTIGVPRYAIGTVVPAVPRVPVPPHNCPPTPPLPGAPTVVTSNCSHTSVGRWCRFCQAHVVQEPSSQG